MLAMRRDAEQDTSLRRACQNVVDLIRRAQQFQKRKPGLISATTSDASRAHCKSVYRRLEHLADIRVGFHTVPEVFELLCLGIQHRLIHVTKRHDPRSLGRQNVGDMRASPPLETQDAEATIVIRPPDLRP